jgi:hypothetical protein
VISPLLESQNSQAAFGGLEFNCRAFVIFGEVYPGKSLWGLNPTFLQPVLQVGRIEVSKRMHEEISPSLEGTVGIWRL